MHLSMETPFGAVYLEVDGSDTPDVIKAKIKDMGYKLKNYWYLNLQPMIQPMEGSSQILVRTATRRKIISFRVESHHTIAKVKSGIHSIEGIPPFAQRLFFAGKRLENSYTLAHYNISQGSNLDLVLNSGGQLKVETTSGNTLSLIVDRSFTIKEVKSLIEDQIGISIGQQRLVNVDAGEELLDTNVLGFYLIKNEAILRLVDYTLMTSRNEMQVNVKIVAAGKTIRLNVVSSTTINYVKNMIQKSQHIPIGEQVLYLPQKRLEDDTFTLAQYYILNETTLYLVQIPENHEGKEDIPQDQQLTNYKESILSKRQRLSD